MSHLNLKIQGGTRFGNRKEQIFSCELMYLQEGKCLFNDFFFFFVSPLQEFMTAVRVWENVIIQWITLLVIKNSNNKLTRLQTSWKLADHHIHINQSKHAYTLFEQCHNVTLPQWAMLLRQGANSCAEGELKSKHEIPGKENQVYNRDWRPISNYLVEY